MPHNAIDWVVSKESWTLGTQTWDNISADSGVVSALTLPKSVAAVAAAVLPADIRQQVAAPESSDEWTCLRVVGDTHWMLDIPATGTTWKAVFDVRIEVLDTEPLSGLPLFPAAGFDLSDPIDANRSFMDHKSWIAYRDSTWTDIAINQAPYGGSFHWDIGVKRKIAPSQAICMTVQWTQAEGAALLIPDLRMMNRIRILAGFND